MNSEMSEKPCRNCGEKFAPKTRTQTYCSRLCSVAAIAERHHQNKPPPTPAEIRDKCEEIQAGWTREQCEARKVVKADPVTVPVIASAGVLQQVTSTSLGREYADVAAPF